MNCEIRKRARWAVVLLAVGAIGSYAAAAAYSSPSTVKHHTSKASLSRISTHGIPLGVHGSALGVRGAAPSEANVDFLGVTQTTLLGTQGGDSFYRLDRFTGPACYALGPASVAVTVGIVVCPSPSTFPSASEPVLDLSVWGMNKGDAAIHLMKLDGVAADGVRSIRLSDAAGKTVASVPVVGNVFSATVSSTAAVHEDGLDSTGAVVSRVH